jgi:glycine cleavage system aminomethyltransferase T
VGNTVVGRITSAEHSIALGRAIGLGWMRTLDGGFPDRATTGSDTTATVVTTPFYDPDGGRMRG